MSTSSSNREFNKAELVEKIKNAKESLCIIGATIFDLDWDDLLGIYDKNGYPINGKLGNQDGLAYKFFNNNFNIQILRESETLIAQYVLLSQSASDKDVSSYSRGNLNGVKDNVIRGLKCGLEKYAKENNLPLTGIEPIEDVYKKELKSLSAQVVRRETIEAIKKFSLDNQFYEYIVDSIKKYFEDCMNDFAEQITRKIGWKNANSVMMKVSQLTEEFVDKFILAIKDINILIDLKIDEILRNNQITSNEYIFIDGLGEIKKNSDCVEISCKKLQNLLHKLVCGFKCLDTEINEKFTSAKEQAERIAAQEVETKKRKYQKDPSRAQRLFIKDCYMPIPVSLIKIDDELFITHALTKFDSINKFQYIGNINSPNFVDDEHNKPYRSYWIKEFQEYYSMYFDRTIPNGVQKYSTEETSKGDRKEVIDIFNESRVRIGMGPRDAFLSNMAIVKSVVWALIFDREGRMLIHRRSENAKDNRGLWDKSVGGHVSVEDLDTIEAIKREITEELYTIEHEGQGGHDQVEWLVTNKNKIIYLGDWKTGRYPDLKQLHLNSDEYYAFSLNYSDINKKNFRMEIVPTERVLPGGKVVKAKCFVDPYLCIMAKDFNVEKLNNSKFALLTPNELKMCVLSGQIRLDDKYHYTTDTSKRLENFKVTSDLSYLVNSSIWDDVVTEFSKRIKENFATEK